MKKILTAIMIFGITFSAMAQTADMDKSDKKEFRKERKQDHEEKMAALNLTEDQKTQVKAADQDFAKKMKDLKTQGSLTVDEQKTQREALVKEHREKMAAILTPEQRTQAAGMMKNEHPKMGMKSERFDKMTKDLNLTQEQSTKMEALNSTLKTSIKGIRDNSLLSQDEKKAQMMSLMKQHKTDMESLLTDDQKEQLKNNRKNRMTKAV